MGNYFSLACSRRTPFRRFILATENTRKVDLLVNQKLRKVDLLVNHIKRQGCRFSSLSNTQAFLTVFIILNILPPLLIFQIPGNGFPDSCSECFGRIPT